MLALLAEHPGATKRDLARLTGLKGSDRILLKRLLNELEAEGAIAGRAKRGFTKAANCRKWPCSKSPAWTMTANAGPAAELGNQRRRRPSIYVMPPKEGGALGAGERILARLEKRGESYEASIVRRLESERRTRAGRAARDRARVARRCRWSARRAANMPWTSATLAARRTTNWCCANLVGRIAGFATVRVVERIGSMDSPKTISLIAIHAHGIPTEFPQAVLDEAKAAKPVDPQGPHRSARHSAGHHRSRRCARP